MVWGWEEMARATQPPTGAVASPEVPGPVKFPLFAAAGAGNLGSHFPGRADERIRG